MNRRDVLTVGALITVVAIAAAGVIVTRGRAEPAVRVTPGAAMAYDASLDGARPSLAVYDARMPRRTPGKVKHVRLELSHQKIVIAPGVEYNGWTIGGTVPGPVIRVTQGDTVDVTIVNNANMPHSVDFHSAEIAPSRVYTNLLPRQSLHYRFVANVVGAFMYHCGTAPVAQHIANGMYGAFVVDPVQPLPPAQEFVLVQSEFYTKPDNGKGELDWSATLHGSPAYVVFNGRASQYAEQPITVNAGERVRIYVVNAGPNHTSAFHVVGAIFDRVYADGVPGNALRGVQTWDVPVGGGAVFEARLNEPGTYPIVTHSFADATKGAVGLFKVVVPTTEE